MDRKNLQPSGYDPDHPDRERIERKVAHFGWTVIQIALDDDYPGPPFSFSLGLTHTHGHPEVILLGQPGEVAATIINSIGRAVAQGDRTLPGRQYTDFGELPLAFVTVDPAHYKQYVGTAMWFYHGPHFPLLQAVWPLKSGHYPWDDGYDPKEAANQPLLGHHLPVGAAPDRPTE